MRRCCFIIVVALLAASCTAPERETPAGASAPIVLTEANFEAEVLQSKVPVLVDFWAPWCAPCRALAPAVDEVAEEFAGKVRVAKLDIDEAPQIAAKYDIRSIPMLILFRNGEVRRELLGLPRGDVKTALIDWLNAALE